MTDPTKPIEPAPPCVPAPRQAQRVNITIPISPQVDARVENLRELRSVGGAKLSRARLLGRAIELGLAELEREVAG